MKKLALFGGSGRTGKIFLEKALAQGYEVKALVRSPEKIQDQKSDKLMIIQGDVLNAERVDETVNGTEAVVSLFGHVKGSPADLQTKGTQFILEAMRNHGLKRIISLSGGGLPYPEKDKPKFPDHMIRGIMKVVAAKMLNDAISHAKVLRNSEMDWEIIRAPRLTDEPEKGNYREGWVGVNASTKIGRADLANFILDELQHYKYSKEMPFVSY